MEGESATLNNNPCQARPKLAKIISNKTLFYPIIASGNNAVDVVIFFMIHMLCVPNKVKNKDVKLFNSISGVNERRFLVHH